MSVTSLAPEASASANFATIAEGTSSGSLHPLDKLDNRRVREMSQLENRIFCCNGLLNAMNAMRGEHQSPQISSPLHPCPASLMRPLIAGQSENCLPLALNKEHISGELIFASIQILWRRPVTGSEFAAPTKNTGVRRAAEMNIPVATVARRWKCCSSTVWRR